MKKNVLIVCFMIIVAISGFARGEGDDDSFTIAGIVFQNDLFMKTVQLGMQAAGKEHNVTVLLGNSDNKIDKEASLIDTYIARKVDAIVITPIGNEGTSDAALQRAADAGIKIVYFNTYAGVPAVSHVGTSDPSVGKASGVAAREFIEKNMAGQELHVATVSYRSQLAESAEARTSGFLDQIKDMPNYDLVAEQDAWLAEMAVRVVGDMLTANPNINIIGAANDGGLIGAVQAVRNAGLEGKVFVFGVAGSDQVAQMLLAEDNVLQFSVAQDAFTIGKIAAETAIKSLSGEPVEEKIEVAPYLLSRDDPAGIKQYQADLQSYQ